MRGLPVGVGLFFGAEVREGQQVDLDAVGNQSRTAPGDLAPRAQIGDVGDPELAQRRAALVVEAAQLTGPEQPPGPQR